MSTHESDAGRIPATTDTPVLQPPACEGEPAATFAVERLDGWTRARQGAFLRALSTSHNVAAAARSVGMSRQSAYKLRARLKGEPFDLAWDAAFSTSFDALSEAAMNRALNGIEVPHYYRGELVGTSRRFDERLTVALLAMRARLVDQAPRHSGESVRYAIQNLEPLIDRVEHGEEFWFSDADMQAAEYADIADESGDQDDDPAAGLTDGE